MSEDVEIRRDIRSLDEWNAFHAANPQFTNLDYLGSLADRICAEGVVEPLSNAIVPGRTIPLSPNLREGLVHGLINSRIRAVLLEIETVIQERRIRNPKIYATEAVTQFALKLRGKYSRFIGSEYATTEEQKRDIFPIMSEDLQDLSFPSEQFDIVTTNEVLEHVPSIDAALAEIHRVLKPGGYHIGTVPFCYPQDESVVRAKIEDGVLIHLTEPEYHGNPVDERGSLVFELPGWNILPRARAAGFSDASIRFVLSTRHGCIADHIGGILILFLQK